MPEAFEVPQSLPGLEEERTGPKWFRHESQELTSEEKVLKGPHGSTLTAKSQQIHITRVLSCNIGSAKTTINSAPVNSTKDTQLRTLITCSEADIVLIQEENCNYDVLPDNLHPNERCRGWFKKHQCVTAHNTHAPINKGAKLQGGVSVKAINEIGDKIDQMETDPSGLGRWCSIRFRGKQGMMLTAFSAYRPCRNNRDSMSVYNQHSNYLLANNDMTDPLKAFLRDLTTALQVVYDRGDQIILGADMNVNLKKTKIFDELYDKFNLHEQILDMHGSEAPRTFIKGKDTIDGIIVSRTLQCTACGYLSPDQSAGDHLVLWADFSRASVFGDLLNQSTKKEGRRLQLSDPRVVAKYLEQLHKSINLANLINRVEALYQIALAKPTDLDPQRFHGILVDLHNSMEYAESHCRHYKAGNLDWSTILRKHQLTIAYWEAVVRWKQGQGIDRRYLQTIQLFRLDGIKEPMTSISLARAHRILRLQKRNYRKEAKRKHTPNRITFLEDLAEAQQVEEHKDTEATKKEKATRAKKLKQLLQNEASRKMHRIIRSTKPSKYGENISELSAPPLGDPDGEWTTHSDKTSVETAALTFLMEHYRQARDTPSVQPETIEVFGLYGEKPATQQVIQGTFDFPANLDPFLIDLLKHCRKPGSIETIPLIMSRKDFQEIWRHGTKEKTTSSPHSPHFGHYKAIAKDYKLSGMMAQVLSLPMMVGFSPELYRVMTALMLQKRPGNIRVDTQRWIVLLNSMFSASCRFTARKVAQNATKHKLIAKEQMGSQKQMTAMSQDITLRLVTDLSIQRRQPISITASDLEHCYDRTAPLIPSIQEQCCGLQLPAILSRLITTQELVAHIRTAHGDSAISSRDVWIVPVHRQSPITSSIMGSPDAPMKWALATTPVLESMRSKGFGVAFQTAITGETIELIGGMFVDDGTYFQQAPSNKGADVVSLTQEAQSYLRGLFWATGGAIHPKKSFWWLIDFTWNAGVPTLKKKAMINQIRIEDKNGNLVTLPQCNFNEARKILGVHLAPQDEGKGQTKALKQKATTWATYASTRKINPTYAWAGLNTGIMKSIEWPLPACTLSEQQCTSIMAIILKVGLRAARIQWRLPRAILYGSPEVLGIGHKNLYSTMGISRLQELLNHSSKRTDTGGLVRATYQQLQVELGLPGQVFEWDYDHWKSVITKDTWIGAQWEFTSQFKIGLTPASPPLKARRVNDVFLMLILHALNLPDKEKKAFQRCRLFLQATTLTDICNAEGTQVTEDSWLGVRRENEPMFYGWPLQKRPPPMDWQVWLKVLQSVTVPDVRQRNRALRQPLGIWNDGQRQDWTWFFSPDELRLYERTPTGWQFYIHRGMAQRPNAGIYNGPFLVDSPPRRCFRAKIKKYRQGGHKLMGFGLEDMTVNIRTPTPTTFFEAVAQLPPFEAYLLEHVRGISDRALTAITESIQDGTARIVSDGSFYPATQRAAFQVRIEDRLKKHQIRVTQYVPGHLKDNDAYRAEAAGICTGFLLLRTICSLQGITQGSIKLGCDGESALEKSTSTSWVIRTSDKHHDILHAAQTFRNQLPITIRKHWIRSHQNEGPNAIPYCMLDRMTQLNVDCDTGAKALAREPLPASSPPILTDLWYLSLNGKQLVNDLEDTLRKAIHDPQLLEYWHEKEKLSKDAHSLVYWPALQHAMKNARHCRKKFVTKFYSEQCGVGTTLVKWGYRDSAKCPLCGFPLENTEHVLHCQHCTATDRWTVSIDKLDTFLQEQKTERNLRIAIVRFLRNWQSNPDFYLVSIEFDHIFAAQAQIGWTNFLFGFTAIEWQQSQQQYYQRLGSKRTGKRWVSALIRKLWDIAWDLWDHRNKQLHSPGKLDEYEDTDLLNAQTRVEFALGPPPNCPAQYRPHYRYSDVDEILAMSNFNRDQWLQRSRLIRRRLQESIPMLAERNAFRAWLLNRAP